MSLYTLGSNHNMHNTQHSSHKFRTFLAKNHLDFWTVSDFGKSLNNKYFHLCARTTTGGDLGRKKEPPRLEVSNGIMSSLFGRRVKTSSRLCLISDWSISRNLKKKKMLRLGGSRYYELGDLNWNRWEMSACKMIFFCLFFGEKFHWSIYH